MKRIQYVKTDSGVVIVSIDEVDSDYEQHQALKRYHNFFHNTPLHGGREWKQLTPEEIETFFREAAAECLAQFEQRRNEAKYRHQRSWFFTKGWRMLTRWQPSEVPTLRQLLDEMAARCETLADWMEQNANRPFYAGSDMSDYIEKPRRVAALLRAA